MPEDKVQCLGCGHLNTHQLYFLNDYRYIGMEFPFSIRQCDSCQLIFIHPVPTDNQIEELFHNLYSQKNIYLPELAFYYAEEKSEEHLQAILGAFSEYLQLLQQFQSSGRLLDLGCGEGLFLKLARDKGWSVDGADSALDAVQRAKEKYGLNITLGTVNSVNFPENQFDAITLLDFIEHLSHPQQVLENTYRWLKPGGILFIATPNQASILEKLASMIYRLSLGKIRSPLYRIYMMPHFLYFTPQTLTDMLRKAGLEIVLVKKENTNLNRIHLSPLLRIALHVIFGISKIIGLQNRVVVIARKV